MVGQLEHGGHTYFGELIQPHDPERHDGVAGPAEEFGMKFHPPLAYDQAAPGEPFVKIGVGVLKRKDDKPYTFFGRYEWVKRGTWTVEKNADSIKFLQELTHGQRAALCPEPFLDIQLQPGESKSWTTAYACRTEVEKR